MSRRVSRLLSFVLALLVTVSLSNSGLQVNASNDDIISDGVFGNYNSMNEGQISNFINAFPKSCLKPENFPAGLSPVTWSEPLGYSVYGDNVSPARIIYNSANLYKINPQVLIATLEKEQGIVSGNSVYGGCVRQMYNSAMGYNCPDGSEQALKAYPGIGIGDDQKTCVARESNVTFSRQVNHAAWQLSFDAHRSYGDLAWLGDGATPYVGFMTQGHRARIQGGIVQYYDGIAIIDGSPIQLANGPTAALYNYTPHFNSFERIFRQWFGATHSTNIPGCTEATNTSLSCVWKARDNSKGVEVITADHATINDYVNRLGYSFLGKDFIARNSLARAAGNIPIYAMKKPSGATFLTANYNEYTLLSGAFTPQGIIFYADPQGSNTGYPVYRLYSSSIANHVITSSPDQYVQAGYVNEGEIFTSLSPVVQEPAPPSGQSLVYRFKDMPQNKHFWTVDVWERDQMIRAGYHYDGVGWRSSQSATNTPVYRLYAPQLQSHLFTSDAWERQVLLGNGIWRDEGVAFYATSSGTPVYRLYRAQNYEHLFTSDAWERHVLVSQGVFRDEGTAWYQP